jgi:hypothetical protein
VRVARRDGDHLCRAWLEGLHSHYLRCVVAMCLSAMGAEERRDRVNAHAIIRSGIGDDLVAGHLVGAGEVRAAQEETSHALSRGNIVGGEEVCGADDEGVVGSDVGRGVVVVCSRALCGCGRGTHDGGGVFVGDGSRGFVMMLGGG